MLSRYADLLTEYSLRLKPNHKILIKTSTLAEPLVKKLYEKCLKMGCYVDVDLDFENKDRLFFDHASEDVLKKNPIFYEKAVNDYDALIRIIAPHNLKSTASVSSDKKKVVQEAMAPLRKRYMERSAKKELQWTLCVYPTQSAAQEANMSLSEYEEFIYQGCMLHTTNPIQSWQKLSSGQKQLVDFLNKADQIQYIGEKTNLTFSTKGRLWINSDGHYNMPSGEVFTGPVENSVNGEIYFSYPTVYEGADVEGVQLTVKDGIVQQWSATVGQDVLDRVFSIDGARQFGEVAIGTNYAIQRATKNILFDEKIGGSIHMAIGASYPETGGKNESAVHWDMIKDMRNGGQIIVDGTTIYQDGLFTLPEALSINN